MNNRYRLAITLLLAALLAGGNATAAGVVVRGNVYGGGNLANVGQSVTVNLSAGEVRGDVYGGGALANTNTDNNGNDALVYSTTVNLNGGTVKGDVYGGGLGRLESGTEGEEGYLESKEATEYGDILVTLNGTMLVTGNNNHGRVFGANNINGTPKGHVKVVVNKTTQVPEQAIDVAAVFGGGNQAAYNPYSNEEYAEVEINMTTGNNARLLVGTVFGGGNEAGTDNTAGTEVKIIDGIVKTGVYGGCNTSGTVSGDTKVSVTGGTIGTDWGNNTPATMPTLVFGGGLGHETLVSGSVTVEIGAITPAVAPATEPTISGSATIWGDVYGGSAKGLVNATKGDTEQNPTYTTTSGKTTLVDVYSGTVKGDVYGGGLGDDTYAADVYGDITVNIGTGTVDEDGFATAVYGNATINGSVYGCNNLNGTPKGDVVVNVYKTAHTSEDAYPTENDDNDENNEVDDLRELAALVADYAQASYSNKFAIAAVYGGGNHAAYDPASVAQNETPHSTLVHVYGCSNNTIQTVYGGGNAANATNVNVIIDGGFFDRVFGGGNGYSATGNHSDSNAPDYNPGANISGSATTQIHGGLFRQLFGGSNQYGDVANASLSIDNDSECTELINESFGGANEAEIHGNVTTTLACGDNTFESFYGGSNMASIYGSVTLNVYGGYYTNVFGGSKGCAEDTEHNITAVSADISGDVTLNLYGGTMTNAFGGSNFKGNIGGKITVNVLNNGGDCGLSVTNIYGGGNMTPYTPTYALQEGETERISPVVNLIHGTVTNVFGGAKGATATVTASPQVNIGYDATTMGDLETPNTLLYSITQDAANYTSETTPASFTATVNGNVYGGGDQAQVAGSTAVNVYKGTVNHDVYGGGALANVGLSANGNTPATTHQVTINSGTIGNVYGGGLGQLANGNDPAVAADVYGTVTVTTKGGTAQNVFGCNNNYGSPKLTVAVNINGGTIGNVYGGGNLAEYNGTGGVSVSMTNGTANYVYGGGLGETAVVRGSTSVTISGNTSTETQIYNDVYGGGSRADVTQNVTVSIKGGRIQNDVYGGGALANTNTGNWNGNELDDDVWSEVTGLNVGSSKVFGYYTRSGSEGSYTYTEIKDADALAQANTIYYRHGTPYKTLVNLTGGVIGHHNNNTASDYLGGNVYGGGLGQLANGDDPQAEGYLPSIEATVYGDVEVTLDGTAFIQRSKIPYEGANSVPFSGRVFGCNNLNGSPKSNVTVRVLKTTMLDDNDQPTDEHDENKYDVHSVYGGGNLSPYQPIDNTKTIWVIVNGCDDVTIEKVFGGGNSAGVPDTKVLILACLKVGYAFGGGNGADKIWNGVNDWNENDGAPVTNTATIMAYGGRIGQVFSGSDTKGTVQTAYIWLKGKAPEPGQSSGSITGNEYTSNTCPLRITNSYGAGRGADINGDVNFIVSGCNENDEIENVFGGSYDANIRGNITLTITSGIFTHVYGGNDHGGTVGGDITVNIEETEGCAPIIIQHLYGGGREAAYPGTDAKKVTGSTGTGDNITYTYENVSSGNITVNIKSATRIDNVYGGSYKAATTANTKVNINMIKGSYAGETFTLPTGYRGNTIPNSNMDVTYGVVTSGITVDKTLVYGYYTYNSETQKYTQITDQDAKAEDGVTYYLATPTGSITINNDIGTIGNVYGGCYESEGFLSGNATINIGTETKEKVLKRRNNDPDVYVWGGKIVDANGNEIYEGGKLKSGKTINDVAYDEYDVLGAHITGNIYGGGCLADIGRYNADNDQVIVIGNTYVNIGAKDNAAVTEGASGITIAGNVYGGGKGSDLTFKCENAMVTGSTNVAIGNGTVGGTVYGGGMVGRVEANTSVTIGFGVTNNSTSTPEIGGNVLGAGQGVATHGYSGLVRGNSTVTIQGETKILGSVYGGGQKASVGRFYVKNINDGGFEDKDNYSDVPTGMPYYPISGGKCTVTIQGYAEIGPDDMVMNNTNTGKPDDSGHVFGACMGLIPYVDIKPGTGEGQGPGRYYINDYDIYTWERYDDEDDYLRFIQTLALASNTEVTIAGHAFIKGSVYGGSENGRVLADTYVKIQDDCQIGNGYVQMADDGTYLVTKKSVNRRYTDDEWSEKKLIDPLKDGTRVSGSYTSSLPECASWPYGVTIGEGENAKKVYAPYDPYATYLKESDGKYYYDPEYTIYAEGGRPAGSDGHTFYGNVFGGGSGYYPYKNTNGKVRWHKEAGAVGGNTTVEITGGHILTNIYGGNEMTNVGKGEKSTNSGKCTIEFSGTATLGVPRTLAQIDKHPVTGYLFGAGKGDQRIFFNKQTNVNDVDIKITGGRIFGSVFGGGEDGHVYHDVKMVIGDAESHTGPTIGTWGTSYVDGNVFGGGRGFGGDSYTAGNVGGSVNLDIHGGTMLGSVYGGGRLGSVGYGLYEATTDGQPTPGYGEIRPDGKYDDGTTANVNTGGGFKRGYITINITGGTIGNDNEFVYIAPTVTGDDLTNAKANMPNTILDSNNRLLHTKGGNVYAGGMGRSTMLDGSDIKNIDWKKLGNVKSTKLTISGSTVIKGNVYGGGEFGAVLGSHTSNNKALGTEIIIQGGTIGTFIGNTYYYGSVFGGGMGDNIKLGGDVMTNTLVDISGGTINRNVYGGGEIGSVGTISNYAQLEDKDNGRYIYRHDYPEKAGDGALYSFGLSWPYEFNYDQTTGLATVNISSAAKVRGDVYGSGKGEVDLKESDITKQRFKEALIANVRETDVTINLTYSPTSNPDLTQNCIGGSVYGGGEDGHVYEDAKVTITQGLIGGSVFGGGKGEGTYTTKLLDYTITSTPTLKNNSEPIYSWTAGKVYGNTTVIMNNGWVMQNVYGGGFFGSVGKGNYAGGKDDYYPNGYGELPLNDINEDPGSMLWTSSYNPNVENSKKDFAYHFMNSGLATVTINNGIIGTPSGEEDAVTHFPYGNVFGSSRGKAAIAIPGQLSPRYKYIPNFYLGYVNKTNVTIGDGTGNVPRIYGSVYGGGQDGHVRRDAKVTINNGVIGLEFNAANKALLNTNNIKDTRWMTRGNVYGAGSGLGLDSNDTYNYSSGSVTCAAEVEINGGTIYQNVYGGGALASIGPPKVFQPDDENDVPVNGTKSYSYTSVTINGGQIGNTDGYAAKYGGNVYGASHGNEDLNLDVTRYATDLWSKVIIKETDPTNKPTVIEGNVFGGGEFGIVKQGVTVDIMGGTIKHNVYGGGALANTQTSAYASTLAGRSTVVNLTGGSMDNVYGGGLGRLKFTNNIPESDIAPTSGNVTVNLNQGVATTAKGAIVNKIFGANDLNGTPKGHIKVHVFATQNGQLLAPKENDVSSNISANYKYPKHPVMGDKNNPNETLDHYLDRLAANNVYGSISSVTTAITNVRNAVGENAKNAALEALDKELAKLYDVQAVYGGGNLAAYIPTDPDESTPFNETTDGTEVIIDGCEYTSIRQVYGGGNAASVSGTSVTVNGTYEIDEVFGGGNGMDDYILNEDVGPWYQNPGANVGYFNYTNLQYKETLQDGKYYYKAVENTDATTKDKREQNYGYGSGTASTDIRGGTIHAAYGGSNNKGNIRTTAFSVYADEAGCDLVINETYGGGKNAEMDGEINMTLDCAPQMDKIYGGARDANINNNVTVNITNGTFQQVFGGNNETGTIRGSITVNVKEEGCRPIHVGALYGGGYKAPYSIYGYYEDDNGDLQPRTKEQYENAIKNKSEQEIIAAGLAGLPYKDPRINIISATEIDTIYGGGFQARMIGNPHVNINMEEGIIKEAYGNYITSILQKEIENGQDGTFAGKQHVDDNGNLFTGAGRTGEDNTGDYILGIGTVGIVYGGGNQADVEGSTYVEIGTGQWYNKDFEEEMDGTYGTDVTARTTFTYKDVTDENNITTKKWTYPKTTVVNGQETVTTEPIDGRPTPSRNAAIITGDVYGGGNQADVKINTNVTIGDKAITAINGHPNLKIEHNVYGGGNMGSVGTISNYDDLDKKDNNGKSIYKHDDIRTESGKEVVYGFGLSWPYELIYAKYTDENGDEQYTGKSTVNIYGGRIGISGKDWFNKTDLNDKNEEYKVREDNGDVYGGSRGRAGGKEGEESNRYNEAKIANVRETEVNIKLPTPTNSDYQDISVLASYDYDDEDLEWKMKYALKLKEGYSGIAGSVYGGGEDGHVYNNTNVNIDGGYIGHGVYGGGKGKGTYETTLTKIEDTSKSYTTEIYSWTAGRVYGNTNVTMTDGYVMRSIYGGGNLGSVGVGNYASGDDDYYPNGYGETIKNGTDGNLWDGVSDESKAFLNSGKSTVEITGGRIGFMPSFSTPVEYTSYTADSKKIKDGNNNVLEHETVLNNTDLSGNKNAKGNDITLNDYYKFVKKFIYKDDLPTGNVFGGSRGTSAPDVGKLSPRYKYAPEFFLGYVNETSVTIGNGSKGPRILGSVYGGGQDGHVRRDATVDIKKGEIGLEYSTANRKLVGKLSYNVDESNLNDQTSQDAIANHADFTDDQWLHRGNVYGAGSGLGKYKYDINGDKQYDDEVTVTLDGGKVLAETGYGSSAGSVTRFTTVSVGSGIDGNTGGIIYRNIYGGGSLSSIGPAKIIQTYDPYLPTDQQHLNDVGKQTLTKVDISGSVGHTSSHNAGYGGNVYGASRGSTSLDSKTFATNFFSTVNVKNHANILGSVFGGGEAGLVKNDTYVNVTGTDIDDAVIGYDLFGGGEQADVNGNTNVTITGGHIMHNVYGGGNQGSVGTITNYDDLDKTDENTPPKYLYKHDDAEDTGAAKGALYDFGLSWPYELNYKETTGLAKIRISGNSRIGLDGDDDGDVFGASKGKTAERYTEAKLYNVRSTDIEINLPISHDITVSETTEGENGESQTTETTVNTSEIDKFIDKIISVKPIQDSESGDTEDKLYIDDDVACIAGSVYGGGEDGHVYKDANITLKNGLVGHAIYGGGKGKGQYQGTILDYHSPNKDVVITTNIYSLMAGRVYGNTNVTMENGYVMRNIYGGGNLGSVGIGNYAGGSDDYSTDGYGELPPKTASGSVGSLWTNSTFMNSGIATVIIEKGTVGYISKDKASLNKKSGLPIGNVFGGCRGMAAPNYNDISPRWKYFPEFFFGYVNDARVIIGTANGGPTILGSVYGGGQDGHVRRDAIVTINNGVIGTEYNDDNRTYLGTDKKKQNDTETSVKKGEDLDHMQWRGRGNVYAAGSGTGEYEHIWSETSGNETVSHTETGYNYSSGSVTGVAQVNINGGTIYQNVYGGGSLASIGPPPTRPGVVENKAEEVEVTVSGSSQKVMKLQTVDPSERLSYTASFVNINGGQIGNNTNFSNGYGGNVYGASRGDYDGSLKASHPNMITSMYATTVWTEVKIGGTAKVLGNVFGGGESGAVKADTKVIIGGKPVGGGTNAQRRGEGSQQPVQSSGNGAQPAMQSGQQRTVTPQQAQPASPAGNAATESTGARTINTNRVNQ